MQNRLVHHLISCALLKVYISAKLLTDIGPPCAQRRLVVHIVVLYHRGSAQSRSHKPSMTDVCTLTQFSSKKSRRGRFKIPKSVKLIYTYNKWTDLSVYRYLTQCNMKTPKRSHSSPFSQIVQSFCPKVPFLLWIERCTQTVQLGECSRTCRRKDGSDSMISTADTGGKNSLVTEVTLTLVHRFRHQTHLGLQPFKGNVLDTEHMSMSCSNTLQV